MCLEILIPKPKRTPIKGYVIVRPHGSGVKRSKFQLKAQLLYKTRVWYTAEVYTLWTNPWSRNVSEDYQSGFHVYLHKKDALSYRYGIDEVWECDIDEINTYGEQWGAKIAVAGERRLTRRIARGKR